MLLYEDHKTHKDRSHWMVYGLAFSPDGSTLASAGMDGALFLRACSGERYPIIEPETNSLPVHSIAYADDRTLVAGGAFGWHGYRRNGSGAWDGFGQSKTTPTNAIAILDDHTLAVGTGDRDRLTKGAFELWDLATGRRREPQFKEQNGVWAVAVCPERRMVAWVTGHRIVRIWEVSRQQRPVEFPQPKPCRAVAINPAGTQFAAAVDYVVRVYNIEKRVPRFELKHSGTVKTLAYSPDGSTIATGSWDQTVKLWDAETGKERLTFKWPIGRVYCLAFAPDGLRLAAGGDLGSVVVWDME